MSHRLAWIALAFCFLAARYQNTPGVLTDHGAVFNGTDTYYRLHRIEKMVEGDWIYPLKDTDLSFPDGFEVPWPLGLDASIAWPLKALGVRHPSTVQAASAVAIPVLALPALWAVFAALSALCGFGWALAGGILLSLSSAHIGCSAIGKLDHHFLESVFPLLILVVLARARTSGWNPRPSLIAILAAAPSFWPQAWIMGPFLAAAFALDDDNGGRTYAPELFFWAAILSLIPLSFSERFLSGYVSVYGFSWITPMTYMALSLAFLVLKVLFRKGLCLIERFVIPVLGIAGAVFLALHNSWDFVLRSARDVTSAATAAGATMGATAEAMSVLSFDASDWARLGLIPLLSGLAFLTVWGVRREFRWLLGFCAVPMALPFLQNRFMPMAVGPAVILTVMLLRNLYFMFGKADPLLRRFVAAVAVFALAWPSAPGLRLTSRENAHPFFRPAIGAARFLLKENEIFPKPRQDSAVAADWDYGHWILHTADMPVVSHPFQDAASLETLALFHSEDPEALDRYLARRPIRYLLLDAPSSRMEYWMKSLGMDTSRYFRPGPAIQGRAAMITLPAFDLLFLPRFFLRGGADPAGISPPNWRLVFVSPFSTPGDARHSAFKILERVVGATLRLRSKTPPTFIRAEIQSRDGPLLFRRPPRNLGDGVWEWRVPYGETDRGGVSFDGRYGLEFEDGPVTLDPPIRESDIHSGATIDVSLFFPAKFDMQRPSE